MPWAVLFQLINNGLVDASALCADFDMDWAGRLPLLDRRVGFDFWPCFFYFMVNVMKYLAFFLCFSTSYLSHTTCFTYLSLFDGSGSCVCLPLPVV